MPKLIKSEPSKDRRSSKYVFSVHGHGFMELTKIFNEHPPHRTIVCVPSAFGCGLGCTFCHLTKAGSRTNAPITIEQLQAAINQVPRDETIPLLVSFMGAGEPLLNLRLIRAMAVRHPVSLATSLPTWKAVEDLAELVLEMPEASIKIYVSVHSFLQDTRRRLMPSSDVDVGAAIRLLGGLPNLKDTVGHTEESTARVVVHYLLIPGENDTEADFAACARTLKDNEALGIAPPKIKFLAWSDSDNEQGSRAWIERLHTLGLPAKFHRPNASDIGGACGQFNPEFYI